MTTKEKLQHIIEWLKGCIDKNAQLVDECELYNLPYKKYYEGCVYAYKNALRALEDDFKEELK